MLNSTLQDKKFLSIWAVWDLKVTTTTDLRTKWCEKCIKSISFDKLIGVARKCQMGGTKQMVQLIYLKQPW